MRTCLSQQADVVHSMVRGPDVIPSKLVMMTRSCTRYPGAGVIIPVSL